jgi:hypothetical protein
MAGVEVSFPAPSRDGEHRSVKREQGAMSEHRDVRVRAGPPAEKRRGEAARLADALNGIGCADERTHMRVRAGKRSMDGCLRLGAPGREQARSYTKRK